MVDIELLATLGLVKIEWVSDRIQTFADVKPRHIGQPVTAEIIHVIANRDSIPLVGTLEGREGSEVIINGVSYGRTEIQNIRVWRRIIRKETS
jgi:hypothetical protein